jgi:KipI family sensor histidine kinase inhibitor
VSRPGRPITPLGDAALTVAFADDFDPEATRRVRALARILGAAPLPGMLEVVPAYVALTIHYQPLEIDFATLRDLVQGLLESAAPPPEPVAPATIAIPVRYDGPDLEEVARRTGLSPAEVIALHAGREYEVALLGFVPGFAYLSELDPRLVLPRRETPRTRVPAGSVAIAGAQTGVYPAATPGGWHLIGRTSLRLFDPAREPAALLAVGDRVRFVAEPG